MHQGHVKNWTKEEFDKMMKVAIKQVEEASNNTGRRSFEELYAVWNNPQNTFESVPIIERLPVIH